MFASWEESYHRPRQGIKQQTYHFADKGLYSQSHGFASSYVWTWELEHKEFWAPKNWCFQIAVPEKILKKPWIVRQSNQSILTEINSEYSLEGLMPKLRFQYFVHLMQTADS